MATNHKTQLQSSNGRIVLALVFALLMVTHLSTANAKYASIVIDADSGKVLHEANADTLNYPASLTKMMTLYMVFSALNSKKISLATRWKVSWAASRQPPSKLGLKKGQTITVENCILALTTKSANDVAVVVAEGLAGSELRFAQKMTLQARRLKMKRTTFRNASGLPHPKQKTTARDISTLALALMRDFPEHYRYFSTRAFKYGRRFYKNHNKLLYSYRGTDGIKTGYIRASGYNLAASTVRDGRRLIGVVMGGRTSRARNRHMVSLLDNGFAKLQREGPRVAAKRPENRPLLISSSNNKTKVKTPRPTSTPFMEYAKQLKKKQKLTWGIQVGAFSYFKPAESAASHAKITVPQLLNSSRLVVSPIRKQQRLIYRARLVGIAEQQAREACQILIAKNISCITVPPSRQHAALN